MKLIAINIYVNEVNYTSNYDDFDEKQEAELVSLIESAAGGKLSYMEFRADNKLLFFPDEILKHSIISLVYDN